MKHRVDITQWRDHTEEPVIVWVPINAYIADPYAVDDSHENDLHDEYARAFFASGQYQTLEQLEEGAAWYDLTPAEIEELYQRGDGSADRAGLPVEWYAEGCNEDGSDAVIYVDQDTEYNTSRESLKEAARDLDPEDVATIYRAILEARAEYAY